jgi:hypothetical protein
MNLERASKSWNPDNLRAKGNPYDINELGHSRNICFPTEELSFIMEAVSGTKA